MLTVDVRHRLGDFDLACRFQSTERVIGVFGPSGAGKSTLLRIVAGLIRPDAGRVTLDGRRVFDAGQRLHVPAHKRRVGYVFQQARLFAHLNVRHNLRYGAWFARRRLTGADFAHVVDMLDIGTLLGRPIAGLSGGEQQRVAIGRALLADPRVLLLDEPLASLDDARKNEVLPYIERLRDEARLPIVYVSHQLDELLRLANRHVVALDAGRVAFSGTAAHFLARPELLGADQARGAGVLLAATVVGVETAHGLTVLDLAGQRLYVPRLAQPEDTRVQLHVRARDVMLARERPTAISALNVLDATVTAVVNAEDYSTDVTMDCGGQPLVARITRKSADALGIAPGDRLHAIIKSMALAEQAWQRLGGL